MTGLKIRSIFQVVRITWNFKVITKTIDQNITNLIIFPNPAQNQVNIEFRLSVSEPVSIKIYNLFGKELLFLPLNVYQAGINDVNLALPDFGSGIYLMEFRTSNELKIEKILIQK